MASAFDDLLGPAPAAQAPGGSAFDDLLPPASPVAAAPPTEAVKPPPGKLESLLRGGRAGATMGFGDELAGALDSVLSGFKEGAYTKGRDEARALDKAAKEANPGTYLAGELGGGLATSVIPGAGIVKGAGLGANIVRGAGAGILSGIGNSEGQSAQEIARDAAVSGLAGGALGGVVGTVAGKLVGGATQRVENAELAGLKEGVQYSTKLKTFGKATPEAPQGQFTAPIKAALKSEPAIKEAVAKDAHRALGMVDAKVEGLTDTLGTIYEKAATGGPVPTASVAKGLAAAAKEFTTTADEGIASTINGVATRLVEKHPDGIPVQTLREEYRAWQDVANRSSKLFSSKSPKEEAAEATANALRETLQAHVAEVATRMPELGISRAALEATNKEVSTWLRVQRALTEKASRQNIEAAPAGDTMNMVGNLIKHPLRTAADVVGKAALPADQAVAKMIVAAKRGDPMAKMALRAMTPGAGRAVAANAMDIPGGALSAVASPFLPDDQSY